jgi:hypothetical protein
MAEGLLHSLTAQPGRLTSGDVLKLFTTAGSPGPEMQAFDPALCTALEQLVQEQLLQRTLTLDDMCLFAGLLQHMLLQTAGGDRQMGELLLGPGVITTEHLK